MNILQTKQENVSANVTNVNTPGYKFQEVIQSTRYTADDKLHRRKKCRQKKRVRALCFGNEVDEIYKNFNQGILYETGLDTDYAIVGNGFFTIEMNDGTIAYTRNGNFKLNEDNQLVTMEGYIVLDEINDFENYQNLNRIGDTLFTSDDAPIEIEGEVRQGFLERSNVDVIDELVKMIEISREFEANQKVLLAADETLNKAVNDVGRV